MSYNSKYKSSKIEEILDSVGGKQDAINDLSAIREGASKGATSVQPEDISKFLTIEDVAAVAKTGNYNDLTDKPTIPSAVTESTVSGWGFTKNAGTITGVSANGTSVATSGVANIPAASTSKYGVTKLSSATDSTSTSLAATASAVKAAYDLANGKVGESDIFENKTDGIIKAEALYNDKSQGGLIYALPTSRLALEDNCDDVLVARSEIFAGSPEQSMLQADAFYETTTGTIYGLPTSSIVTNGGEDEIIATQSYVDNAVANAGGGGGSSSGNGEVYITPFTVEQFCTGSVELTDEQRDELLNAASQNRIIGMPYMNSQRGYIIADYNYSLNEDLEYWELNLEVIYNGAHYNNGINSSITPNNFRSSRAIITTFRPTIYEVTVEDGVANVFDNISLPDNCIFWVLGECTELQIGLEPSDIGKAVRFFTSESCALEFFRPVYWANGEIPTIEPYTHYELSLVANMEGVFNAVLTPFKPVE